MDFWDRVKLGVDNGITTYARIADKLGVWESRVSGWHRGPKKIIPPADYAVVMAKMLETTVEELVDGEKGEQYLKEYIHKKGWGFTLPERIVDIVKDVQRLSNDDLVPVRGVIKSLVDKREKESNEEPQAQPGEAV
jgi:transcriptional regulator with XRE-family HTH domain